MAGRSRGAGSAAVNDRRCADRPVVVEIRICGFGIFIYAYVSVLVAVVAFADGVRGIHTGGRNYRAAVDSDRLTGMTVAAADARAAPVARLQKAQQQRTDKYSGIEGFRRIHVAVILGIIVDIHCRVEPVF